MLVSSHLVRWVTEHPLHGPKQDKSLKWLNFKSFIAVLPPLQMEETKMSENGVYEVGFLFVPSITEEKTPEVFGELKDSIISLGADSIVAEEFPKLIPLAYTMEKTISNKNERFKEGWFGWVKFEMDAALVAKLDAKLRLKEDIIRHLLISTTRENTIASKRPFGVRRRAGQDVTKDKETPEMSKEEIDREIEALVADKPEEQA